jgi:hypothetical protein
LTSKITLSCNKIVENERDTQRFGQRRIESNYSRMRNRNDESPPALTQTRPRSIGDLQRLWGASCDSGEDDQNALPAGFDDAFIYVRPGTYRGQREGYFCYELSCGDPADEFRFFVSPCLACHRIEYWFADNFEHAHRVLCGGHGRFLAKLWERLRDNRSAGAALTSATMEAT